MVLKAAGTVGVVGAASVSLSESAAAERGPLAGFRGTACKTSRTSNETLPFDTNEEYGGLGGHGYHCTESGLGEQNPIAFVHGNTHDRCDFAEHATEYLRRGYKGDALWSITFRRESSTRPEMRDQLDDFVSNIREYTGAETIDIVSHSLGVTGARFWMDDRDRYDWVDTFVGCAGANHGTYTCGPNCEQGTGTARPCGFISPDCADEPGEPLYELNRPDETPGDVEYYTIRGGADYFYLENPNSPKLEGAAENVLLENGAHNATRASETSISLILQWVTDGNLPEGNANSETVSATGSRQDAGDAFTAGQTNRIDISVEADEPVVVRDQVPTSGTYSPGKAQMSPVSARTHTKGPSTSTLRGRKRANATTSRTLSKHRARPETPVAISSARSKSARPAAANGSPSRGPRTPTPSLLLIPTRRRTVTNTVGFSSHLFTDSRGGPDRHAHPCTSSRRYTCRTDGTTRRSST